MTTLKLALPKGRMNANIMSLLAEMGIAVRDGGRSLRPRCNDAGIEIKLLKPQNIATLVSLGAHDIGFCGYDWLQETDADVVDVLDTGMDGVSIVAAAPAGLDVRALGRKAIVVSEYERLAKEYIRTIGFDCSFVRSFGATEAFPPEDADMIIDNSASGQTLRENGLEVKDVILTSSTRFIASKQAIGDPAKRERIEAMARLMRSVLLAREKSMLEMNCAADALSSVCASLPAMRNPTVSRLQDGGYAVKAVVPKKDVPGLIEALSGAGATDILEYGVRKVTP